MGKTKVKINFNLYCIHHEKFVKMEITPSDKEVPSYIAKCPKCGIEVLFDFESMSIGY